MKYQCSLPPSAEGRYIASIDLGSHTARFLVCKIVEAPILFRPVARKRYYTNLAEGFNQEDIGVFSNSSMERAISAVENFGSMAHEYSVDKIVGAATGIFRRAENSQELLDKIKELTGIEIKIISGEDEAAITLKGIFHALGLTDYPDAFFDLGGSTTEIIYKTGDKTEVVSLPIGAFVLTDLFLRHDPPIETEVDDLKHYVHNILNREIGSFNKSREFRLIGSGGTVTSLAAMMMNFDKKDVTPEAINGIQLERAEVRELYCSLKPLSYSERKNIKSIDEGRAKVILSGAIAVLSIMDYFDSINLTASYSDILEGLIISFLKGGKNE